jgi:hypothetical protein
MGANFRQELERLLFEAGCMFVRNGKGDHAIWHSPISGMSFPVDSKIISRHTANGVLKQAGLPKHF